MSMPYCRPQKRSPMRRRSSKEDLSVISKGETVKVDLNDLVGDTEYNLYVAVRNINPLVYSDLASEVIDTHVPYTEMITLESVGLTSFSYHIMKPEG